MVHWVATEHVVKSCTKAVDAGSSSSKFFLVASEEQEFDCKYHPR